MFEVLMSFFKIFNAVALMILVICCACALLSNIKLSKLATAKISLPSFKTCSTAFKSSCISSSIFMITNWVFFSSNYISEEGFDGKSILTEELLSVASAWAIFLAGVIVLEIIMKFFKNSSVALKDAILPVMVRSVWCFVLAFIIA